jgi:hypothetical protein
MRFIVKWNNGFWKVFDTVRYEDHSLQYLQKDAEAVARNLNAGK